jgi:alpha-D-xyloside xylohydrolase
MVLATLAVALKIREICRLSPFSIAALAAACGGESTTPPPARPAITLTAGNFSIRVDPDPGDIALMSGEQKLLDFPIDGLELGAVTKVDDAFNYDPWGLVTENVLQPPPDGLDFLAVTHVDVKTQSATSLTLALTYTGGKTASLQIDADPSGRFKLQLVPDKTAPIAYFRLRPRADKTEGFYGLGELYDDVNQRKKQRAMQLENDSTLESHYNEAHVPIPLLIGTKGWGLFVDSPYPGAFDVATQSDDLVEVTFGTGAKSSDGLTFHLFAAAQPLDITKLYYDVTGYPRLPARWALGPWVWRDDVKDQAQAEADLQAMRDLDLADNGYWLDRPYATAVNTFDFNAPQFPDPQKLFDKMKSLGFHGALWHTPYLDEKDPTASKATAALRMEAKSKGYYPPAVGILLNKWGPPMDLTNPAAYSWWQGNLAPYKKIGVVGYKLDYGEDVVPGLTNARNEWAFSDGSDERTMHGRFQLFFHKVYAEMLPEGGGFLLCRHGTPGDQKNGPIIWPGDLDASFAHQADMVKDPGGDYVAVGGLPASIIAGLSVGPSGFPFYASDTGGYRHSPPDKELFTRWFEQTALSTAMQIGNSASTVAWEPDPMTGYDDEMLGWYRTYTRLHVRLFPYEWTYATNLAKDGRAITRALGLAYPDLGQHPNDHYMFGDSLLVAPVVERKATTKAVIFPKGRWLDWWTGKSYDGGQTITVPAPLGTLPLFLAEGGIVPMLRPTIDTLSAVDDPMKVDSYATTPGVLYVRVAPGVASSFTLFDGVVVSQALSGKTLSLSYKDGSELKYGALFEAIGMAKKPTAVGEGSTPLAEVASLAALEMAASGWAYAPDTGGTVFVKVGPGTHSVSVTLP